MVNDTYDFDVGRRLKNLEASSAVSPSSTRCASTSTISPEDWHTETSIRSHVHAERRPFAPTFVRMASSSLTVDSPDICTSASTVEYPPRRRVLSGAGQLAQQPFPGHVRRDRAALHDRGRFRPRDRSAVRIQQPPALDMPAVGALVAPDRPRFLRRLDAATGAGQHRREWG